MYLDIECTICMVLKIKLYIQKISPLIFLWKFNLFFKCYPPDVHLSEQA